jgi:hypothetical protein
VTFHELTFHEIGVPRGVVPRAGVPRAVVPRNVVPRNVVPRLAVVPKIPTYVHMYSIIIVVSIPFDFVLMLSYFRLILIPYCNVLIHTYVINL